MNSRIKGAEAAKMIGCSVNTLIMFKKELGMTANYKITADDLPKFKEMHDEWVRTKAERRQGTGHLKHYKQCMNILKRDGCIENTVLTGIFGVSNMTNIQAFFENQGEPLYKENELKSVFVKNKVKQFKVVNYYLFNVLKQQMREENLNYGSGKPHKNGHVRTNESRRLV